MDSHIFDFHTWRIDQILDEAASEAVGELPKESPYLYVAKIIVSDSDAVVGFKNFSCSPKNFCF